VDPKVNAYKNCELLTLKLDHVERVAPLTVKAPYISPVKLFNQKASRLCPAYRAAKGHRQKLSTCQSCVLKRCVVPEGNL
jgi:hypothetical protein